MKRKFLFIIFALYILLVIKLTQFPIDLRFRIHFNDIRYNLKPFHTAYQRLSYMVNYHSANHWTNSEILDITLDTFKDFGCNILLFCPLGVLLPLISWKNNSIKRVFLFSFLFSLCIETSQLIIMITTLTPWRCFDIDDIIANSLGGVLGILFYKVIQRYVLQKSAKERLNSWFS